MGDMEGCRSFPAHTSERCAILCHMLWRCRRRVHQLCILVVAPAAYEVSNYGCLMYSAVTWSEVEWFFSQNDVFSEVVVDSGQGCLFSQLAYSGYMADRSVAIWAFWFAPALCKSMTSLFSIIWGSIVELIFL